MAESPGEDGVRIPLRDDDGEVKAWTVLDAEDFAWASKYRWHLSNTGYVGRTKKRKGKKLAFRLHREILGLRHGDPRQADHINGDPLDNRRCNLRVVTQAQNGQNQVAHRDGRSRYRGVSWHRAAGKWDARVCIGGRRHHLGLFDAEEDAARAADSFRREHLPYAQPDPELAKLEEVASG